MLSSIGTIALHPLAALLVSTPYTRHAASFVRPLLFAVSSATSGASGNEWLTWWAGVWMGILVCNMFGLMPIGADGAVTSGLGFALGLSFAVWSALLALGLMGMKCAFFGLFVPSGTPWTLAPVFAGLETVSYGFRAVSLGVRLWANMFSGHTLLHILTSMCLSLVFLAPWTVRLPIAIALFALLSGLACLEWLICFLQAGVFCMLSSFYAGA
jgi:ATP synthase subunit 6